MVQFKGRLINLICNVSSFFLEEKRSKDLRLYLYKKCFRNMGYDKRYFQEIDSYQNSSYPIIAKTILDEFDPKSIVDVGCGSGLLSYAFLNAGCTEIHAFDSSIDAVELAKKRGLSSVRQLDLTKVEEIPAKGDLCICLEVAEHLPESYAESLCKLLSETSPILLFTAARPGQGGHLHINEQPQGYWIEKMDRFSMKYDNEAVIRIRKAFDGKVISWYDQNLMIFRKQY